jgi:hypothetical protein
VQERLKENHRSSEKSEKNDKSGKSGKSEKLRIFARR